VASGAPLAVNAALVVDVGCCVAAAASYVIVVVVDASAGVVLEVLVDVELAGCRAADDADPGTPVERVLVVSAGPVAVEVVLDSLVPAAAGAGVPAAGAVLAARAAAGAAAVVGVPTAATALFGAVADAAVGVAGVGGVCREGAEVVSVVVVVAVVVLTIAVELTDAVAGAATGGV